MTNTARLYGGSLYDLALEEDCVDELEQQLTQVRQIFREAPEYLHLLAEPSLSLEQRQQLIGEALPDANRYLVNFLKLLCERGTLKEFGGCCDAFTARYRQDRNIAAATVTSAIPLTEEQLQALQEKLEQLSGKTVLLCAKTDASVIGGLKVELEGRELDGSVKGRLSGIARRIEEA